MEFWLAFTDFESAVCSLEYPIKGILTNPTLISLPGLPWRETIRRLNEIGDLPLGIQVVSTDELEMMREIAEYRHLVDRRELIVKLPFCLSSLKLVPYIKTLGHKINMAAVCTFNQAAMALETDPEYLSIYVGRVDDSGGDGVALLGDVKSYARACGKNTCIQAASIRTAGQLEESAKSGADAAVIPFVLLEEALKSDITDASIRAFREDWKRYHDTEYRYWYNGA